MNTTSGEEKRRDEKSEDVRIHDLEEYILKTYRLKSKINNHENEHGKEEGMKIT